VNHLSVATSKGTDYRNNLFRSVNNQAMRSELMRQRVPLIVFLLVAVTVLIIPLRILGYGFIPPDDASRHAAKAVSGKDWQEILVVRGDIKMDSHPGWHFILSLIHRITKCDADLLILFSVAALFALFSLFPLLLLERPESWLAALLTLAVAAPGLFLRLFLGRPYMVTMSTILFIGLSWPNLRQRKTQNYTLAVLTALIALSTWIHGGWYLFALPLICFFLARQWRVGYIFAISCITGTVIGAALTGHPYIFIRQMVQHLFLAFNNSGSRLLVLEFKPFAGDYWVVIAVFFMFVWRSLRKSLNRRLIDDPVFILAALCWALGFITQRVWIDIGLSALALWIALEFQDFFDKNSNLISLRRVSTTLVLATVFYLAVTNDVGSRWTENLTIEYLSAENPQHAAWLPEPGGIIYSDDMGVFYRTFFKNPHAPWRYILGFEPAWMPPEDLSIYRKIQWNFGAYQSFKPWVDKMRPEDRLIISRVAEQKPQIPGLEWNYAATGTWIGRLPRQK
jgi:hypothetical protein